MIKCNRCGNMNIAGAVHCQSCGSALSGVDASGSGSNMMSQEQSALPAWLGSLRVGERASRPATNSPTFSPTNIIEEGSLPSWMHTQRDETQNVTGANRPVSLRSSSLPAPSTDGAAFSATSFAAQSLIDEQSLPSWMQEGGAPTSLPPEGGISAGNLVDKDSVPDWMKSLQQQQSVVPGLGQPKQAASTETTVKKVESVSPSPSPASGFAARDLVDQQSLPSWMTQLGNQNPATSASRDQLMQPESFSKSAVNEPPPPIQPGQNGFAARDLIDQQSLPSWMLPQSGQNVAAPINREQEKQSNQPVTGLPASSLLDMNALPSWLAENRQAQAISPAHSQPPPSMASSSQPRPVQEPAVPGSAADFSSVQGGRLAVSSVIDMNALPDWLRSSGGQQSASEMSSQSYSAPYAGPPRVESVRVPSRPRGEISSSETSEMAASVFTSMLGVASAAPNFPAPAGVPYQQQPGQLSYTEQMSLSGVSGIAGIPGQAGTSIAGIGNPSGASMAGIAGRPGAQSMAGIPGGPGAQSMAGISGGPEAQSMAGIAGRPGTQSMAGIPGRPGAQSMAGIPGGPGAQSIVGIAGRPGTQGMAGNAYRNPTGGLTGPSTLGTADEEKNTKKRGLFGALLDWLSR